MHRPKKTVCGLFNTKNSEKILRLTSDANDKFINFLVGKAIDSFIIGIIAFIYLNVRNMPYASLISIIIGVTNMIPFFGPFFGAIPSGLLILLGNQLGVSAFWILVSILIGGGMFGFIGMILAVPFFAVIYPIFANFVHERLRKRNMPVSTSEYYPEEVPKVPEPQKKQK